MERLDRIYRYEQACEFLPHRLKSLALSLPDKQKERVEELRLRVMHPLTVLTGEGELNAAPDGIASLVKAEDLEQMLGAVTEYSRYACIETLRQGFLPLRGGFRLGVCGSAVVREGEVNNLKDISSLALRIVCEHIGLGSDIAPRLFDENGRFMSTLLLSPPGGGKTVASLAFALRHAVAHGMKRVIYVVPYTSIIEQNAEVFREILGDGNVLEHHSGVQFELSDGASPEEVRRALAAENWDMPVIVTTAVQFFESIYANRSSKCRKLHNLADSVIIFDEAQMLPLCHLRPCVAAMASLAEQFRSTLVLCTATQPSLDDLLHTYAPSCPVTELCPQTAEEYDSFRRVTFRQEGILEDDALAERLSEHRQVLCIVNSRKAAQSIFARLPQEASFHLSTLMVPAQRQTLLDEIRRRLKAGEPCRVVSTSLIEAGVDVDFPAVYRELAGLDSVLQAAGRCNREGKRAPEESIVTVFERAELPPMLFRTAIGATRHALKDGRDPAVQETMQRYFRELRALSGETLDKYGIVKAFEDGINGCELPFRTVAENFHLIDQNTRTVYVPFGGGAALIERLKAGECSKELYRKLGRYTVSVYEPHFQKLYAAGALLTAREVPALDEDSAILNDMSLYSETTGLTLEPEMGKAEFI